jgi:uncharacterized protein (DUF2267 family)
MFLDFEQYSKRATVFLEEVARELGTPDDPGHAGRVLTAVLHSLRDMITVEESLDLMAEFPIYIQAIYIDGWKVPGRQKKLIKQEEFLEDVRSQIGISYQKDFGDIENTRKEVQAVFRVINKYISEGEIKDIKSQLPAAIASLLSF